MNTIIKSLITIRFCGAFSSMQFSIYQTINVLLSFNRLEILGFLIDLKIKKHLPHFSSPFWYRTFKYVQLIRVFLNVQNNSIN